MTKSLSRWWLLIGVMALAVAGLFSLVLVVARAPQLAANPLFATVFHKALVVHVDLSVLVWFLCIACLLWSLYAEKTRQILPFEEAALFCFGIGTLLITFSPFNMRGEALMSNYIPVITSPMFFLGLGLLFCGMALMMTKVLTVRSSPTFEGPLQFAIFSTLPITAMAMMAFVWSHMQMPPVIEGQQYYELSFWGGGHVLQFLHVQIVMLAWLMLAKGMKPEFHVYKPHLYALFAVGLVSSLCVPWTYLHYRVEDAGHRQFFTYMMILAGGIAPTVLVLWILPGVLTFWRLIYTDKRALWSSLFMSFVLFIYGGALGALIEGQNVVIPAHYHGSIVGLTIAFMGVAYLLLPRFGWRDVSGWRLAFWQPIIYGGGQVLHISGLAWSGGYGVLRKTPGGLESVSPSVKAAMGLMGLGGLLAIIGGFLFVIVVWKSARR